MEVIHVPVLVEEVLVGLMIKKSGTYVDGTLGPGGHAEAILRKTGGDCTLIGIDRDSEAVGQAKKRLKNYSVHFVRDNFSNMESVVRGLGYREVDGVLLDLGVSSFQLKAEGRGFSFLKDEPLDMRMDSREGLTAGKIVNKYPEKELSDILWRYGEERFCRRIAREIVRTREKQPIMTCRDLAMLIERVVKKKRKMYFPGRIHPATRTFQALRIEVNRELSELTLAVRAGVNILKAGGRICIISYHSLEDRIVKHSYREMAKNGLINIITKKPQLPRKEEKDLNPSSRSAKLRIAERQ